MRVVWDPPGIQTLVASRIEKINESPVVFGECRVAAVFDADGKFAAGVVFNNWDEASGVIEMSAAALDKRWLMRSIVTDLFAYAFNVARLVVVRTRERNQVVRRMMTRFGASEFEIPGLFRQGEALFIYTLTPDQFAASRFFDGRNSWQGRTDAA